MQTMTKERSQKALELRSILGHATGSEQYFRHRLNGLVYTEGVQAMAQCAGAYWLLDIIGSYNNKTFREGNVFQVWELKPAEGDSWVVTCGDGALDVMAHQVIEYSDFPLPEGIKIYCIDGVILLPSEY